MQDRGSVHVSIAIVIGCRDHTRGVRRRSRLSIPSPKCYNRHHSKPRFRSATRQERSIGPKRPCGPSALVSRPGNEPDLGGWIMSPRTPDSFGNVSKNLLVASLLVLLGAAFLAPAASAESNESVPDEILLRFRPFLPELEALRAIDAAGGALVETQEVLDYHKIRLDGAVSPEAALARLERDPRVLWAEFNGTWNAIACVPCPQDPFLVDLPDALPENQWGAFKVGLPFFWRHGGGADTSVVISIVDTGIDDFNTPHPDLSENVSGGYDFVEDDADPTDEGAGADLYGHGTHVAGIAAAASNGIGIAGAAYCAQIQVVRALDCTAGDGCPGQFDDIADGVQWAADNGADVINMSLGGTVPSDAIRSAIQYAIGKGVIVVAASGNDYADQLRYPARYPEVIAVGATNSDDDVADFSNYGPELDVVAPGVDIWSTIPGPGYDAYNGTSMATPLVSGIAALLRDRNPAMGQTEMERYLRNHTQELTGGNAAKDGYGRVDFQKLEDWSDARGGYPTARHANYLWETLGEGASAERSTTDPNDTDFRPNSGGPDDWDGFDNGLFPESYFYLPWVPPHIEMFPQDIGFELSVCGFDGPRYGSDPSEQLHLDVWADWDSDETWEEGASGEHVVIDHLEDPGTWGADGTIISMGISPVDEHILGNPLVIRSRLNYGESVGTPDGEAKYGEVEDHHLINFVEDFDVSQRVHTGGVYMDLGTWEISDDPSNQCQHHGMWEFAWTLHPTGGAPCNDAYEVANIMKTPVMDWSEYTVVGLGFWYCHQIFDNCSDLGDDCRVQVRTESGVEVLGPIPFGSGYLDFDISDLVGHSSVTVEFVEETDWIGTLAIDDVVILAFDGERPVMITDLGLTRAPGSRKADLTWTSPDENEYIPSPPAEGLANIYSYRYAKDPITDPGAWNAATPLLPADRVSGSPVPAPPGSPEAVSFDLPSAHQTYYVGMVAQDEVNNISFLSNSPGDPGDSTAVMLGVDIVSLDNAVAAPGDTAMLNFQVTNTGNASDSYSLSAADTEGWDLAPNPGFRALGPGDDSIFTLQVVVPPDAEDALIDTVGVTARSLTDPDVSDSDFGEVEVDAPSDVPDQADLPRFASLQMAGANPFRGAIAMELAVPRSVRAKVRVFDQGGRLVRELVDGKVDAGVHRLRWDGSDRSGRPVASGVYFVEAQAGEAVFRKRLMRLK
ncbi:MAG: S8 family serine peptidase [Candidatus Eisenbacteria bacterium]|nr:S8 family serine peptidase [Candidatus Latescibacterota bacterium]MBD3302797.1 S8 family serine peptidase [Candidatus Eisenbacteria bacterium]